MTAARLPAEQLLEALEEARRHGLVLGAARDSEQRAIERAMADGSLTVFAADKLAVGLLGTHPALIWGALWWSGWTPPAPAEVVEPVSAAVAA